MTYKDFETDLFENVLPQRDVHLRIGQTVMGHLHTVWPKEYKRIVDSRITDGAEIYGVDCFYNDRLASATLKHLNRVWHLYPE